MKGYDITGNAKRVLLIRTVVTIYDKAPINPRHWFALKTKKNPLGD